MKIPAEMRHTMRVTNRPSHSDSPPASARNLASWPAPVIEPPFLISGGIGLSKDDLAKTAVFGPTPCDIAVVGVTLLEYGVTHEHGRRTDQWFSQIDAAVIAMEWVAQDLADTNVLHLFLGRKEAGTIPTPTDSGAVFVPLNMNTWRVTASARRWSVMPFTLRGSEAVGVFRTRLVRDSCPAWLWHHLAGHLLLDSAKLVKT